MSDDFRDQIDIDPREAFLIEEDAYMDDLPCEADFVSDDDFSSRFADDMDEFMEGDCSDLEEDFDDFDDNMTDAEADADTFRSMGWGLDEEYGYFGDDS
jgi:hypothetical protein